MDFHKWLYTLLYLYLFPIHFFRHFCCRMYRSYSHNTQRKTEPPKFPRLKLSWAAWSCDHGYFRIQTRHFRLLGSAATPYVVHSTVRSAFLGFPSCFPSKSNSYPAYVFVSTSSSDRSSSSSVSRSTLSDSRSRRNLSSLSQWHRPSCWLTLRTTHRQCRSYQQCNILQGSVVT